MFARESESIQMACNFNHTFEKQGLLKVTVSHVHCKYDNISETALDRVVVTNLLQTTDRRHNVAQSAERM